MTTQSIAEVHAALTAPGQFFEMEELDVRGVHLRAWKNAPRSLRAVLEVSRVHGEATFLVYEDERTTFEEHFRQTAALAHVLRDRYGVEKGDRVAIAMRNFPEWSLAFWAAAAAGAIVVPLNAWWTKPELEYGLEDSGSKVVFVDGERYDRLGNRPGLIVARPEGDAGDAERFDDVLGDAWRDTGITLPDVDLDPEDEATIFYTSGT